MPAPRRRTRPLREILRYRNPEVIHRFLEAWKVTPAVARRVFDDMKRYLWLVTQPGNHMLAPVPIVDEMWHTFLAFTVDYAAFGQRYFGRMVHHVPTSSHEKKAFARLQRTAPARAFAAAEKRMLQEVTTVYDALGEAVVLRWYVAYAEHYGPKFFQTQRQPPPIPRVQVPAALRRRAR